MFKKVLKKLMTPVSKSAGSQKQQRQKQFVSPDLNQVMTLLDRRLGSASDLVFRKLLIGNGTLPSLVVYLDNMVDKKTVNEAIIAKLQEAPTEFLENVKVMAYSVLAVSKVTVTTDFNKLMEGLLNGGTLVFLQGFNQAVLANTMGWEKRSIEPPQTEVNVEGPKESFVESRGVNLTMIRRRLRNENLRFVDVSVGSRSKTTLTLIYFQGITDPGIVAEAQRRLEAIETDSFLALETLHEYLKDQPLTPFPTMMKTERPEKVVAGLMEGQFAILADGYPLAFLAPVTFPQFLQAGDDYYNGFYFGTFSRWIRMFAFFATLVLPSFYIALVTHHWEMMPTSLALSLAGGREGVPFPVLFEVFAMEFTFEVLREAGIRLPKAVGQAVSIVGALVIGQAAVQAGFVSPGIVIIVAFTGITSFAIPVYTASIPFRILRFPLMLVTSQLGLPGLVAGILMIWGHMASLTSFGVPYMAPLTPLMAKDLKDTVVRVPRWAMLTRPQSIPSMDPKRMEATPIPPEGENE